MNDILIRLPWPPSKTSKNGSQGDFMGKAYAAKKYKQTCAWACKSQGVHSLNSDAASVEVTYFPPRNGRMDWDNIVARCKQGFDAVAEAVGIDDSKWDPVAVRRGTKTPHGCVLVHIRPGKADAWKDAVDAVQGMVRGSVG